MVVEHKVTMNCPSVAGHLPLGYGAHFSSRKRVLPVSRWLKTWTYPTLCNRKSGVRHPVPLASMLSEFNMDRNARAKPNGL